MLAPDKVEAGREASNRWKMEKAKREMKEKQEMKEKKD